MGLHASYSCLGCWVMETRAGAGSCLAQVRRDAGSAAPAQSWCLHYQIDEGQVMNVFVACMLVDTYTMLLSWEYVN